jgi:hypothetical protein
VGLRPVKEKAGLCAWNKQPADVYIPDYPLDKLGSTFDFSVVNPVH